MENALMGFLIGWLVAFFFIYFAGGMGIQGDMNNDGELTIVDLSILAEEIRNGKN